MLERVEGQEEVSLNKYAVSKSRVLQQSRSASHSSPSQPACRACVLSRTESELKEECVIIKLRIFKLSGSVEGLGCATFVTPLPVIPIGELNP